jgi:hypothetical protein
MKNKKIVKIFNSKKIIQTITQIMVVHVDQNPVNNIFYIYFKIK